MFSSSVTERINKSLESLFVHNALGCNSPFVCVVCDQILHPKDVIYISPEKLSTFEKYLNPRYHFEVNETLLKQCYTVYAEGCSDDLNKTLTTMALSPRSPFIKNKNSKEKCFTICKKCRNSLNHCKPPRNAIANNFFIGTPPIELIDLSPVELALLTPVQTYGYCFTYTGGISKKLKGSLTFFKTKIEDIIRSIDKFELLGLTKNVVVVFHGKMTQEQKRKAKQKTTIRTDKVIAAVNWLRLNNKLWRQCDFTDYEINKHCQNLQYIDCCKIVGDERERIIENTNTEKTETFQVFFPDDSLLPTTGGQKSVEQFKELVIEKEKQGFQIEFINNISKEPTNDYEGNNLILSSILQFPYGECGLNDEHVVDSAGNKKKISNIEFIEHVTRLSQPQFHFDIFTLILYNMSMKHHMIHSASLSVRDKYNASNISSEITDADIRNALKSKKTKQILNKNQKTIVKCIDAVSKSVPHSNEAARKARGEAEAIFHEYGCPSYFFTVTPDDDNSYLMQVFSYEDIDNMQLSENMSNETLFKNAQARTKLRLKVPGIAAIVFEYILEIIITDVLAWDLKASLPRTDVIGLFGLIDAFTCSIEEQGRLSLHAHFMVWSPKYTAMREQLWSENARKATIAEKQLIQDTESISTSSLIGRNLSDNNIHHKISIPCNCEDCPSDPEVVTEQELRILRTTNDHAFVRCRNCNREWTSTQFLESFLIDKHRIKGLTKLPDTDIRRLKSMCIDYQMDKIKELDWFVLEAAYNFHIHCKACFSKSKNQKDREDNTQNENKKRKCNFGNMECRYRYPKMHRGSSEIVNVTDTKKMWFYWDGSHDQRHIKEINLKKHHYDCFQNTSCPHVSHSKLTCNTNILPLMPGPIAFYAFKYSMKPNQDEDTADFKKIADVTQKIFSQRKYADNKREALRKVLAASFLQQDSNVCGAPLAAYLTRNKTRFILSHQTTWCPLQDIIDLLENRPVHVGLRTSKHTKVSYFVSQALNYLCRPDELENTCAFEFFTTYKAVSKTKKNEGNILLFQNTEKFCHPSIKNGKCHDGVEEKERTLIRIWSRHFPDTAMFKGNIVSSTSIPCENSEKYAQFAIALFLPIRTLADMKINGSFTARFREAFCNGLLHSSTESFLQNVQDANYNFVRHHIKSDELQRITHEINVAENEDTDIQDVISPTTNYDFDMLLQMLQSLNQNPKWNPHNIQNTNGIPSTFSGLILRKKGAFKSGFTNLATMNTLLDEDISHFIETEHVPANEIHHITDDTTIPIRYRAERTSIVQILLTKHTYRTMSFEDITQMNKGNVVSVLEANGSAKSIIDWGIKANLDKQQRKAFEVIASSFVLSFYSDTIDTDNSKHVRHHFVKQKKLLQRLSGQKDTQLICFLHGPGGSGKTTVIDLVKEYARQFCSFLDDFNFTDKTIVVTAMTGSAATILLGSTTHSALHMNRVCAFSQEDIDEWADSRLLIIDEISFAHKKDFKKISDNLRILMSSTNIYGNLNVVFCGDLRQMEPVRAEPIYNDNTPLFSQAITCYIELLGMHRFKLDLEYGRLLFRLRDGLATLADIDKLNSRTVTETTVLPQNITYACYANKERDAINTALFIQRCQNRDNLNDSILIFSDNLKIDNGSGQLTAFEHAHYFYENCGEDDIKLSSKARMDPVLKLYKGCRVQLTENMDVSEGKANGTQATVSTIVLKPGTIPVPVSVGGVQVKAVQASNVSQVILNHTNSRIVPSSFTVETKNHHFNARLPLPQELQHGTKKFEYFKMSATQLQFIVSNAMSGHKLQGMGLPTIFVHDWHYASNWPYVVLSRVKTFNGLYIRRPLKRDLTVYQLPQKYISMISHLKTKTPTYFDNDDYKSIFQYT